MLDGLLKSGWKDTAALRKNVSRTLVYEQKGDEGLVLEERDDALWLWIEGTGDRRVFSFTPSEEAQVSALLSALNGIRDQLTVDSYLEHYGTLQEVCPVSIVAWEQFDNSPPSGGEPHDTQPFDMAAAQRAAADLAAGKGGEADPVVFPGQPIAKLSDYVGFMKLMQTGNMQGALAKFGLDMMSMSTVMTAWGQKLAQDPMLAQKFAAQMV
jgi:hypothetical protein